MRGLLGDGYPSHAEKQWEKAQARIAELEDLVRVLVDNNPDDYAADAVTVYDVWIKRAKEVLGDE